MYPHRMRLHGPWEYQPLAHLELDPDGSLREIEKDLPPHGRIKIPRFWSESELAGFRGRARLRRHFHRPRVIEPDESLWLVFEGGDYFATARLNGVELGRHRGMCDRFEFDVTQFVQPRNVLDVEIACPLENHGGARWMIRPAPAMQVVDGSPTPERHGGIWNNAALEVRSIAFLRDVVVWGTHGREGGSVRVRGTLVGVAAEPLALDLTHVTGTFDERLLRSIRLLPTPEGTPFDVAGSIDSAAPWLPGRGAPALYRVRLELHGHARTLDRIERRIGFRTSDLATDLRHEPFAPELFTSADWHDELDESGMAVGQEILPPLPCAASAEVIDDARRQVRALVARLGHHACIATWILDAATARNPELAAGIAEEIARLDPSRPLQTLARMQ